MRKSQLNSGSKEIERGKAPARPPRLSAVRFPHPKSSLAHMSSWRTHRAIDRSCSINARHQIFVKDTCKVRPPLEREESRVPLTPSGPTPFRFAHGNYGQSAAAIRSSTQSLRHSRDLVRAEALGYHFFLLPRAKSVLARRPAPPKLRVDRSRPGRLPKTKTACARNDETGPCLGHRSTTSPIYANVREPSALRFLDTAPFAGCYELATRN